MARLVGILILPSFRSFAERSKAAASLAVKKAKSSSLVMKMHLSSSSAPLKTSVKWIVSTSSQSSEFTSSSQIFLFLAPLGRPLRRLGRSPSTPWRGVPRCLDSAADVSLPDSGWPSPISQGSTWPLGTGCPSITSGTSLAGDAGPQRKV